MKSNEPCPPLDLAPGWLASPADAAALRWRARQPLSFEEYFRFLESLGDVDPSILRARRGPCGRERFEL